MCTHIKALNALGIPTTRALALTLLPKCRVIRERFEPGAIVARFAQSWLRIGSFDILHARGDRVLIRKLATFIAEDVFPGWESLPAALPDSASEEFPTSVDKPGSGVPSHVIQGDQEENRFSRLYRRIARENAKTVAAWQVNTRLSFRHRSFIHSFIRHCIIISSRRMDS